MRLLHDVLFIQCFQVETQDRSLQSSSPQFGESALVYSINEATSEGPSRGTARMRIALMTEPFLPKIDGIVTMLTKTVECLRRRGDEVLIFAPSGGPKELFGAEVV